MKDSQDYTRDIEAIRTMMERSSKFPSLSGWSGIMAGLYAAGGAYFAYDVLHFRPDSLSFNHEDLARTSTGMNDVILTAVAVFIVTIATAVVLTNKKAARDGEKVWNAASRQLLVNLAVPFTAGALCITILVLQDLIGLAIPLSLLFYGLALYSAGKFTYHEVKWLGMVQMGLGLICTSVPEYSVLFWGAGFGAVHILYGFYMHVKYER